MDCAWGEVQLIANMLRKRFKRRTFAHGIHPPEEKWETAGLPIRQFPFSPLLIVPLCQNIGKPALPVVREGQEVTRGQCIAQPDGVMSVAMHAPASGVVRSFALAPSISGQMLPAIYLEPFPSSLQEVTEGVPCRLDTATPAQIIDAIQQAGLVGLGGAGFPTHVKLRIPPDQYVDTLIINGVECEPYLTTDHRIMLECPADVLTGVGYLQKATAATRTIIAVEANKQDAADVLQRELTQRSADGHQAASIRVEVLAVKYPQGAEKMLITALTGREVPAGGLPLDIHTVCVNVSTAAEIGQLLPHGAGLQDRVLTVGGPGVVRKGNYRVPLGTPLRFLLETVGLHRHVTDVFLGGPMMGQAVPRLDIPVTKGTTGVIVLTDQQTQHPTHQRQYPCIHCGHCVDACPLFLNPSQLGLLAMRQRFDEMVQDYHLMDCFECGCCAAVCPSHIPLVQHFRVAKAAARKRKLT